MKDHPRIIRYIQRIRRDNGRVDLYFRKGDLRRGPLASADNTSELQAEVDAILAEIAAAQTAAVPAIGTVRGALKAYNKSAAFLSLERSTQRNYQYKIDELAEVFGDVPLGAVTYAFLKDLQDVWARRGHKACNDLMQVLKNALKPEMAKGTVPNHPFASIVKLKPAVSRGEPHPAWTDDEVQAAIDKAIALKQPGLARGIALGRWGGFRRGGICRIPLHARVNGFDQDDNPQRRLYWTTPKRGVLCDKPEDGRLTDLLNRTPDRASTIAYNARGQPWKERAFNQAVDRLLEKLDEEGKARNFLDIHGLRHARGMELAHGGASEFQIMAQLEHLTPFTARIYIRQASRAKGADDGQARVDDLIRRRKGKAKDDQT